MCLINHFAFQVAGVTVQGDENADDWVTKYYVQFSDDGNSFTTYQKPDGSSEVSVASFSQKRANCFRLWISKLKYIFHVLSRVHRIYFSV